MPANIIDGKRLAAELRERVAAAVKDLAAEGGPSPGLVAVVAGDDPASKVYVRTKRRHAQEAGIQAEEKRLPADVSQDQFLGLIDELNANDAIDAILIQLPLPRGINSRRVIDSVLPEKDVDGFHQKNAGSLAIDDPNVVPCTPLGCLLLLDEEMAGDFSGKEAVVIGRSKIVGKPMAALLTAQNCTVTVAHSRTKDLSKVCRRADIVVAAVGRPEMVRGDWIRKGAVVIDVGINRIEENGKNRLVGDVAFEEAKKVAGAITPVPGGVGPMTVACLLANTVLLHCRRRRIAVPKALDGLVPWFHSESS